MSQKRQKLVAALQSKQRLYKYNLCNGYYVSEMLEEMCFTSFQRINSKKFSKYYLYRITNLKKY